MTGPDDRRFRIPVNRRVTSNNQLLIRQLTLAGAGLSFHAKPEIAGELADGRLVRVLPDWSLPSLSVDALMPPMKSQPAKVKATLDALRGDLSRAEKPEAVARRRR